MRNARQSGLDHWGGSSPESWFLIRPPLYHSTHPGRWRTSSASCCTSCCGSGRGGRPIAVYTSCGSRCCSGRSQLGSTDIARCTSRGNRGGRGRQWSHPVPMTCERSALAYVTIRWVARPRPIRLPCDASGPPSRSRGAFRLKGLGE